jgi:hypothetical protein
MLMVPEQHDGTVTLFQYKLNGLQFTIGWLTVVTLHVPPTINIQFPATQLKVAYSPVSPEHVVKYGVEPLVQT